MTVITIIDAEKGEVMKDLITTIAAISILMVFVFQFSANQVLINRMVASDRAVDEYIEAVSRTGDSDGREAEHLTKRLSETLKCSPKNIKVEQNDKEYQIRAPIDNVVACGKFLGISPEENKTEYIVKGELP